jgi:hypothetical protein
MATGTEIVTRARRRLGIHAEEEALEAVDANAGFDVLTDMLNGWVLDNAIKSFSAPDLGDEVTITIYDDTVFDDEIVFGVTANLAARLANGLGIAIPQSVVIDADAGKNQIVRRHVVAQLADSTYDPALSYMPSQRFIEIEQ